MGKLHGLGEPKRLLKRQISGALLNKKDIVAIGASAGGVEAISSLIGHLPSNFSGSIFVVLHFPEYGTSMLADIIGRKGALVAKQAQDGDPIRPGVVYVAKPGSHLLLKKNHVCLADGPRENGYRPAIDPLFRSAAYSYGDRAIGVLLSGMLDDGVHGLSCIKSYGGTVLVQDPAEALFPTLPLSAIASVDVDEVLSVAALAKKLIELSHTDDPEPDQGGDRLDAVEEAMKEDPLDPIDQGEPSVYTCPECKGTLFEIKESGFGHFRCRVGHAYNPESLENGQAEVVESVLWEALRALEENRSLAQKLQSRSERKGLEASAKHFADRVTAADYRINILRQLLSGEIQWTSRPANQA